MKNYLTESGVRLTFASEEDLRLHQASIIVGLGGKLGRRFVDNIQRARNSDTETSETFIDVLIPPKRLGNVIVWSEMQASELETHAANIPGAIDLATQQRNFATTLRQAQASFTEV